MRTLLVVCVGAFTISLIVMALTVASAPQAPDARGNALPVAASGPGTAEQRVARLQAAVRAQPADAADTLVALGSALLQRVRETGDVSYYVRAERDRSRTRPRPVERRGLHDPRRTAPCPSRLPWRAA